jgi:predicted nucleic acid-binding protein
LIDTSVAVALREGLEPALERAEQLDSIALLSILSVVELEGGVPLAAEGAAIRRQTLDELYATLEILDFGRREANTYRDIVQALGFSRARISDRMIAAQAMVAGAAIATLNARDFRDIPALLIEDWSS